MATKVKKRRYIKTINTSYEKVNCICPICGQNNIRNLNIHAITYYMCSICQHIFLQIHDSQIKNYYNSYNHKLFSSKKWTYKGLFTSEYNDFAKNVANIRYYNIKKFINKNNKILIINSRTHHLLELIKNNHKVNVNAICDDKSFKQYFSIDGISYNSIYDIHEKYDIIYIIDYLEHKFCAYKECIKAMSLLIPGGMFILEIPINNTPKNNNPNKNKISYNIHEFSGISARKLSSNLSLHSDIKFNDDKSMAIIQFKYLKSLLNKETL